MPIQGPRVPPGVRPQPGQTAPAAPAPPAGALDPFELQIKVTMLNDPAGQTIAIEIFRAIKQAHRSWQSMATLIGVNVMAVTANGGMLVGPPLAPLIIANRPGNTPFERKLIQAIGSVVGAGWIAFSATVKAAGLPWYPAFAAFPGPVAPPMPNVPTPFAALTSVPGLISASLLKPQVMAQLAPDQSAGQIVDMVLRAFEQFIAVWKTTTMVTNVLGTGPVPSFAPPYVPVGPVVGGTANMVPGGLI